MQLILAFFIMVLFFCGIALIVGSLWVVHYFVKKHYSRVAAETAVLIIIFLAALAGLYYAFYQLTGLYT